MAALADLQRLSAAQVAARLSAPPAERAAFLAEAAEAGLADAQAAFAQALLDGNGLPADPAAAVGWFARAAEQGHVMAINMLGRCYDLGQGTRVDKPRAAAWYEAAALRGLPEGMYNYATLLALGHGVAQDRALALDWFRRAAGLGFAKAMNFVGSFHEDGWVVPRDLGQAAIHYARAAAGGDFRGQFNHARMLALAGDLEGAAHWLACVPATATPRFLAQAGAWLETQDEPLRTCGKQAIASATDSHYAQQSAARLPD